MGGKSERGRHEPVRSRPAPEDAERLRYAAGRTTVDPRRPLFAPDSLTWRVNREGVLLLGGGRALLLQVAHPLVAAGVAAHSSFREEPLRRLWRTLDLTLTIVFADAGTALRAVRSIERVHARVRGRLREPVGKFPAGTPYDASDPELLFWVHATLVDTALRVYERFVRPLRGGERAAYYEESKVAARLFGIPENYIPGTAEDFAAYVREMIRGPILAVGGEGREIAASILDPPLPLPLRALARSLSFVTVELLPPVLRRRYRLSAGAASDLAMRALAAMACGVLPLLPETARIMPHARRATAAHRGAPCR